MSQCRAKAKTTGQRCRRQAAPGCRVCHFHGAAGGAPLGNKNRLTTGEYETILFDTLTAEEQQLLPLIDTDLVAQLDEQIRLYAIRQRRMLQRIATLAGVDFAVVERRFEKGKGPEGLIDRENITERGALGQIMAIEEALTRVQHRLTQVLELKHRVQNPADLPTGIEEYVRALTRSAADVWGQEEETDEEDAGAGEPH